MEADSGVTEGQRYGHLIRLKPEYRERYIVLHAHPFPGLIERMQAAGLRNYSIFLRDHVLFSYYEYVGDDFEADMAAMADNDTVQDWWTLTDPMQEPLPERGEGEWWTRLEELYHGGEKIIPTEKTERLAFVSTFREGTEAKIRACYAEIGDALADALEDASFQNYNAYRLGMRRYSYLEYAGNALDRDWERLLDTPVFRQLRQRVEPLLAEDAERRPMESVFFMA
jgi:L-rhamnose mutarotase